MITEIKYSELVNLIETVKKSKIMSEISMPEVKGEVKTDADLKSEKKVGRKPTSYYSLDGAFLVEKGIYDILKFNIESKINTLLLGPTGVGKTECISAVAKKLEKNITIFDMGTMTDPIMGLVGTHIIKNEDGSQVSKFIKSRFSEVIQKPGIVLLDELSRASIGANNLLFPCLDSRRELSMEYSFENFDPIKVHPDCVFIATANTGSQYTGTHKLDKALSDRFTILQIDPLNLEGLKYVIKNLKLGLTDEVIANICNIYEEINAKHKDYVISFDLSLRHLKNIARMVASGFTIYDSFYAICKGIDGEDGSETIKSILTPKK